MSKHLSREYGVGLSRLLNYSDNFNQLACTSAGAQRFKIRMCTLAIEQAKTRVNGNIASFKTIEASKGSFGGLASTLWGLGFQLENPEGITEKHVRAVIRHEWAYGISPGAFSVLMTQLKKLSTWIKKPGMVKAPHFYLPEVEPSAFKRQKIAIKSKSATGNGFELETLINRADAINQRFGAMVRLEITFGLRRSEVLQIQPYLDDKNLYLDIRPGVAKNGLARTIPIENKIQRQALDYAKTIVKIREHLGWVDKPSTGNQLLKRNENRYNYYMGKLGLTKKLSGITGHGLRSQYAEDMAVLKGFVPATMGGSTGQLDQESLDLVRLQISKNMGHSRTSVTGAYYGTLKSKIVNSLGQRLGSIQLGEFKLATIFINPPLIAQLSGTYPKLSPRKFESSDITAVIESMSGGIGLEIAKLDLKNVVLAADFEDESLSAADTMHLKKLSTHLLFKFGADLSGYSKLKAN
jgi:integrase